MKLLIGAKTGDNCLNLDSGCRCVWTSRPGPHPNRLESVSQNTRVLKGELRIIRMNEVLAAELEISLRTPEHGLFEHGRARARLSMLSVLEHLRILSKREASLRAFSFSSHSS